MLGKIANALHSIGMDYDSYSLAETIWLWEGIRESENRPGSGHNPSAHNQGISVPQSPPAGAASLKLAEDPDEFPAPIDPMLLHPPNVVTPNEGGTLIPIVARRNLRNMRALNAALGPLMVRSPHPEYSIDIDATVESIAESGGLFTGPCRELGDRRWLRQVLICETGPQTPIWRSTLEEIRRLFSARGAFRSPSWFSLEEKDESVVLREPDTGQVMPAEGMSWHRDVLIVVVSDFVTPGWWTGSFGQCLKRWRLEHHVLLLHLLPEPLWAQTWTGKADARVSGQIPGGSSETLLVTGRRPQGKRPDLQRPLAIAIAPLNADNLERWAQVVVAGPATAAAIRLSSRLRAGARFSLSTVEPKPADRVEAFRARASDQALKLARYLSVTAPLSAPMMQWVQAALLPTSETGHLAEFFLGGLLAEAPGTVEGQDPVYEFIPGVRERLARGMPVTEALEVMRRIGAMLQARREGDQDPYLLVRAGKSLPPDGTDTRAFALISREYLIRVGLLTSTPTKTPEPGLLEVGLAKRYEAIRNELAAGAARTRAMTQLVSEITRVARSREKDASSIRHLFSSGGEGSRLVALAWCVADPHHAPLDILVEALRTPRSAFEQWTALDAMRAATRTLGPIRVEFCIDALLRVLDDPGNWIHDPNDDSRRGLAAEIIRHFAAAVGLLGPSEDEVSRTLLRTWLGGQGRAPDMPSAFVFGSHPSGEYRDLCVALGAELARAGWRLTLALGMNVGKYVVEGFRVSGLTPGLRIYERSGEFLDRLDSAANVAIVIHGAQVTRSECARAIALGIPVLAIASTGGTARQIGDSARQKMTSLGIPDAIARLIDLTSSPEEQAWRIVRIANIVDRLRRPGAQISTLPLISTSHPANALRTLGERDSDTRDVAFEPVVATIPAGTRWSRITRKEIGDALDGSPVSSRFSDPGAGQTVSPRWRTIYLAGSLRSCLQEVILRGLPRPTGEALRGIVNETELARMDWIVIEAVRPLELVDLRGPALKSYGAQNSVVMAPDGRESRKFAAACFIRPENFAGIIYSSSIDSGDLVVLFEERARDALSVVHRGLLSSSDELGDALSELGLGLAPPTSASGDDEPLAAERQVAFVVGNDQYLDTSLPRRRDVKQEVELIAALLRDLGFETHILLNQNTASIRERLSFVRGLRAESAVLYWSGLSRQASEVLFMASDSAIDRPGIGVGLREIAVAVANSSIRQTLLIFDTAVDVPELRATFDIPDATSRSGDGFTAGFPPRGRGLTVLTSGLWIDVGRVYAGAFVSHLDGFLREKVLAGGESVSAREIYEELSTRFARLANPGQSPHPTFLQVANQYEFAFHPPRADSGILTDLPSGSASGPRPEDPLNPPDDANASVMTPSEHLSTDDMISPMGSPRRRVETFANPLSQIYCPLVLVAGTGRDELKEVERQTCIALGTGLARNGYGLITGGWPGVDEVTARSFAGELKRQELPLGSRLIQVVAQGSTSPFREGQIVTVDRGDKEYWVAVERAEVLIMIGGEGGTLEVANFARRAGRPVLPLANTGGDALTYHDRLRTSSTLEGSRSLGQVDIQRLAEAAPGVVSDVLDILDRLSPAPIVQRHTYDPGERYYNPPQEVANKGRRLDDGSFYSLVSQLQSGEVLVGVFRNRAGALVATHLNSSRRLAGVRSVSDQGIDCFALPRIVANRGWPDPVPALDDEVADDAPRVGAATPQPVAGSATASERETKKESFLQPTDRSRLLQIGNWVYEPSGQVIGGGLHSYLISRQDFGARPFTIVASLAFTELPASEWSGNLEMNAGVVFGWQAEASPPRYFNVLLTGKRLLLERVGFHGGDAYKDYEHLSEGAELAVLTNRIYHLEIRFSAQTIECLVDGVAICSFLRPNDSNGRVGLRPWRSQTVCSAFVVQESVLSDTHSGMAGSPAVGPRGETDVASIDDRGIEQMRRLLYESGRYQEVIELGGKLSITAGQNRAEYWLYLAAAFAQKHHQLKKMPGTVAAELESARDNLLDCARRAVKIDSVMQGRLWLISDPQWEDDYLQDFRRDADFLKITGRWNIAR